MEPPNIGIINDHFMSQVARVLLRRHLRVHLTLLQRPVGGLDDVEPRHHTHAHLHRGAVPGVPPPNRSYQHDQHVAWLQLGNRDLDGGRRVARDGAKPSTHCLPRTHRVHVHIVEAAVVRDENDRLLSRPGGALAEARGGAQEGAKEEHKGSAA